MLQSDDDKIKALVFVEFNWLVKQTDNKDTIPHINICNEALPAQGDRTVVLNLPNAVHIMVTPKS